MLLRSLKAVLFVVGFAYMVALHVYIYAGLPYVSHSVADSVAPEEAPPTQPPDRAFTGSPSGSGSHPSLVPAPPRPRTAAQRTNSSQDGPVRQTRKLTDAEKLASLNVLSMIPQRAWDGSTDPPWDPPTDACGRAASFSPVGATPYDPWPDLEKAAGEVPLWKIRRPDMIGRIREAIHVLEEHGRMRKNSYCAVFGSCHDQNLQMLSEHSEVFFVCPKWAPVHASNMLQGVNPNFLPGALGEEGDDNIFCQLADYVLKGFEEMLLAKAGMGNVRCIVQEFFVNRQKSGAWTNPHQHVDDFFGGIFYVDAPKGTRLCYDNSEGTKMKKQWRKYAPNLTVSLGPDQRSAGYVKVRAGDILLAPVSWLRHWVPPIRSLEITRTSIVFNMICI